MPRRSPRPVDYLPGAAVGLFAARVLGEAGANAVSYPTVKRRLPSYATEEFRAALAEPGPHLIDAVVPAWSAG